MFGHFFKNPNSGVKNETSNMEPEIKQRGQT